MPRPAPGPAGAVLAAALALSLFATAVPAAPMQGGGDTREVGSIPRVLFEGPVKVRPGESGAVVFTLHNRYNQTMFSVRYELAFRVGGDWLDARALNGSAGEPAFASSSFLPSDLPQNQTLTVRANFTTSTRTTPGVYLVSLELAFSYANATGAVVPAHFASLGSLDSASRQTLVNMSDYNGTIAALGLDGILPDSSVQVEGGGAETMWWYAAAFGVAVVAVGTAYGWNAERREKGKGR